MGTNYYLRKVCSTCGHAEEELHIGKQSAGWVFLWQGYDDNTLGIHVRSRREWIERIKQALANGWTIQDEYGCDYTLAGFLERVRSEGRRHDEVKSSLGFGWERYLRDDEGNDFVFDDFS